MVHAKKVASVLWPRYSRQIDFLNQNARLADWLAKNRPFREFDISRTMYEWLLEEFVQGSAIDYLEFGVYRGDSVRYWTDLERNSRSRFIGFDSFEGLPEDWHLASKTLRRGHFDVGGNIPDIPDPRVSFVKGWFNETAPRFFDSFAFQNKPIVRIDCDLYSSTLYCLATLDRHLPAGTLVLMDDFSGPLDVFRAWTDYLKAFGRPYRVLAVRHPYYKEVAVELLAGPQGR